MIWTLLCYSSTLELNTKLDVQLNFTKNLQTNIARQQVCKSWGAEHWKKKLDVEINCYLSQYILQRNKRERAALNPITLFTTNIRDLTKKQPFSKLFYSIKRLLCIQCSTSTSSWSYLIAIVWTYIDGMWVESETLLTWCFIDFYVLP